MTTQAQEKETMVLIKTNYGNIKVKLYNDTPLHRDNFIKLVKEGWYENSPFHRVINNFMIQGGGNAMVEKITDIPYLQNSKATISIKRRSCRSETRRPGKPKERIKRLSVLYCARTGLHSSNVEHVLTKIWQEIF